MMEHKCFDLIERRRVITDEMVENGWYPDSESDLWEVVECGADVFEIVDGVECANGHRHYHYGSPTQQLEEMSGAYRND